MNIRPVHLLLVAFTCLAVHDALSQIQVGDPPNQTVQPVTAPVQSYAYIDVSGDTGASYEGQGWELALDDNNNVAFGYAYPYGIMFSPTADNFTVYTWQNGVLSSPQITLDYVALPSYPDGTPDGITQTSFRILPSGAVFGSAFEDPDYGTSQPTQIPYYNCNLESTGGQVTYFPAPAISQSVPVAPFLILTAVAANGTLAGQGTALIPNEEDSFSYVYTAGKYTVFDSTSNPLWAGADGVTIVSYPYDIEGGQIVGVNSAGQAIFANGGPQGQAVFWDGKSLIPMGTGGAPGLGPIPVALNEQGQVICDEVESGEPGATYEGFLWENGTTTVLRDQLPSFLQGQIEDIEPAAISNQAVPNSDATIYILATAQDNGMPVNVVFKRDNTGSWSFAEIQAPQGIVPTFSYQCGSINSSGVILTLAGVDGSSYSHAVLLFPVDIDDQADDNGQDGTTQALKGPIANANENILGVTSNDILKYVRFGLWDNAFLNGALQDVNDASTNFICKDSRMFRFRFQPNPKTNGSQLPKTLFVHWYTDTDQPASSGGNDTLTATQQPPNSGTYVTQPVMLVSDDTDNVPTNTGLPGGGEAAAGAQDHRLRKAALGDKVYFTYTPVGADPTKPPIKFPYPIFNPKPDDYSNPDGIEKVTIQIVNTQGGSGSSAAAYPPNALGDSTTLVNLIKQRLAVAGVNANVQYDPATDIITFPQTSVNLSKVQVGSILTPGGAENIIASAVATRYGSGSRQNTIYLILVNNLVKNNQDVYGESYSDALLPLPAYAIHCSFVESTSPSVWTPAHEIGHQFLTNTATDVKNYHYNGINPQYNLMKGGGTTGTNISVLDSKRLWDCSDGLHTSQIGYLRQSPILSHQ